jgi:tRNA dimethylallyltransferase
MRSADILRAAGREAPVLLAGPTASGKSALAMEIAGRLGGVIVNADALQVFADWRILTARPTPADEAAVPHRLYGHVPGHEPYSVGHWLRDLRPLLGAERPIIVGGTGLYFTALTEGLAEIPPTPPEIRADSDARLAAHGPAPLLAELDPATAARIDRLNPVRVQRAWEVQRTTGRGLAAWQDDTGPPLLPVEKVLAYLIPGDRDWLAPRIARRFEAMLARACWTRRGRTAPAGPRPCPPPRPSARRNSWRTFPATSPWRRRASASSPSPGNMQKGNAPGSVRGCPLGQGSSRIDPCGEFMTNR